MEKIWLGISINIFPPLSWRTRACMYTVKRGTNLHGLTYSQFFRAYLIRRNSQIFMDLEIREIKTNDVKLCIRVGT